MNVLTDQLSQDVFDIISSPSSQVQEAGLRMLQTLLEQKLLDVDTIVPVSGKKLFESLVMHILHHHRGLHPIFSEEASGPWIKATQGRAFSLPTSDGGWLPFKVLHTIASWDAKQKRDKEVRAKVVDGWLSAVLPLLPDEAWQSADAGQALSHAFALKMNVGARVIWDRLPPATTLSSVAQALPATSAGWAWTRFLSEGGSPVHPVSGRPLWQMLLSKFPMSQKHSADGVASAMERWMFQSIREESAPPGVHQFVEKLFRKRGASVAFTGEDWMMMLQDVPLDWTAWKDSSGNAWWKTPAHRCAGLTWFEALESSPHVRSRIDPKEVITERFNVLFEQLSSRGSSPDNTSRMSPIVDHVKQHGWPAGGPFLLQFSVQSLSKVPERKQLHELSTLDPVAWWGAAQNRQEVERAAVDKLVNVVARDAQDWRSIAQTWLVSTQCEAPGVWLEVVGKVVQALCANSPDLSELNQVESSVLCDLCQDPAALSVLASFSKRASKKQAPAFERFLRRAQLEGALAVPPARPKGPRF